VVAQHHLAACRVAAGGSPNLLAGGDNKRVEADELQGGNLGDANAGHGIRTERSRELVGRLSRSIPGGNTRSLAYFPPYPLAISRGSGCRIWDADGNEFVNPS
jgi:hypothetical protein